MNPATTKGLKINISLCWFATSINWSQFLEHFKRSCRPQYNSTMYFSACLSLAKYLIWFFFKEKKKLYTKYNGYILGVPFNEF